VLLGLEEDHGFRPWLGSVRRAAMIGQDPRRRPGMVDGFTPLRTAPIV
jgi:hypothetical protein